MKIPSELKQLRARRFWRVMRFVAKMLKRRIATNRLQRMAADLHMNFFGGDNLMNFGGNFNDHYEFSCFSSPSTISGSSRKNRSKGRFLIGAFVPSCICVNVKDELESESVGIPCDEDEDHCFSFMDPSVSANSNESTSDSTCTNSVSTSRCSYYSSSEIDRQAEEFIATFYQQMRLQRQDSYGKFQETLARGST